MKYPVARRAAPIGRARRGWGLGFTLGLLMCLVAGKPAHASPIISELHWSSPPLSAPGPGAVDPAPIRIELDELSRTDSVTLAIADASPAGRGLVRQAFTIDTSAAVVVLDLPDWEADPTLAGRSQTLLLLDRRRLVLRAGDLTLTSPGRALPAIQGDALLDALSLHTSGTIDRGLAELGPTVDRRAGSVALNRVQPGNIAVGTPDADHQFVANGWRYTANLGHTNRPATPTPSPGSGAIVLGLAGLLTGRVRGRDRGQVRGRR